MKEHTEGQCPGNNIEKNGIGVLILKIEERAQGRSQEAARNIPFSLDFLVNRSWRKRDCFALCVSFFLLSKLFPLWFTQLTVVVWRLLLVS